MLNRRTFLKSSAAAGTLAYLTDPLHGEAGSAAGGTAGDSQPAWLRTLHRIGQTNITEHDPAVLDVEAWADYWAGAKVGVVYVSVTGIIAYYQTQVPFHRKSQYLDGKDFFGELNTAARKRGLRTFARMSPDLNWGDALAAHPEWFMRDEQGNALPTADTPELFQTCMFTGYMTDYMTAIMREINAHYDVDGFYMNGWPMFSLPVCYCSVCRKLPPPKTPAYWDKFNARVMELWKLYDGIAKEKNRAAFYFANMGGGIHATPNLVQVGEISQWFQADNQGRGGMGEPIWGCTQQGRVCSAIMNGKVAANVTGLWSTGPLRWRESIKSPAEAQMWLNETAASGMVPYIHVIGGEKGMGEDRRWEKLGQDYFGWTAKHDAHFTNRRSIANIGVVFGQRTNLFYQAPSGMTMQRNMDGLYSALLEGRFFFDYLHEDQLDGERLKKYAAVILPNIALLSDAQCAQLRAYVEQGGSLLATFESSLYTDQNERRADFGLAEALGIHTAGKVIGPRGNSNPFYARIERQHSILDGFSDTNWLPGAEYRQPVAAVADPILTVVPGFVAYPPELSYPTTPQTTEPAVVLQQKGRSRTAYFPGNIEHSLWIGGNTDLSRLLQNTIRWVAGEGAPVSIEGEGLIDAFAWETEPGYAVHVLNYTNPNTHRGWLRRSYPIGGQRVRLQVPAGRTVKKVELLRAEKEIPFTAGNGAVEFTIPSVEDYEVAALTAS
ncbi:MAG: beta-galactosidase trimerization domain-containing protein [Acidobacteriota bacterium]